MERTGGCLCGDIRFKLTGRPRLVEYCHCETCRKATGAPVTVWIGVARGDFEPMQGTLIRYESSPGVERTFCGRCGTSMTQYSEGFPDELYVSIAALDDPNGLQPEVHIWRSERLTWLETRDDLPRYLRFKAEGTLEELAPT